jgi:hypothetical protein
VLNSAAIKRDLGIGALLVWGDGQTCFGGLGSMASVPRFGSRKWEVVPTGI